MSAADAAARAAAGEGQVRFEQRPCRPFEHAPRRESKHDGEIQHPALFETPVRLLTDIVCSACCPTANVRQCIGHDRVLRVDDCRAYPGSLDVHAKHVAACAWAVGLLRCA